MTDDLVKRLRVPDPCCEEHHTQNEAADRIEELERERDEARKYRDAYAECDRIGTQAVRDLEDLLDKAVVAMRKAADGLDGYVGHGYGDYLRDVLAEIEGGKKDE